MVKKSYKYIKFEEWDSLNGKMAYVCLNKKVGDTLGYAEWYPQWKQYVFVAESEIVVFSAECLEHIADFLHKAAEVE